MKPKRFYFRTTSIFGTPLKYGAPLFIGFTVLISGLDAQAGDILRGGSPSSNKPGRGASGAPTPASTDAARANAKDTLARTTRSLDAARAMQNAARNGAIKNGANHLGKNPNNLTVTLPKVPNGLVTGGLKVAPGVTTDPTKWTGAKLPTQTVKNGKTQVTIKQTEQQALLNWETFNVGKKTTVTFDQAKGGADVGKWIAFNKINDPSGNPTQILGNIKADGQIYLINQNGIIFGGGSQVNARGLTASSLPINDNLIERGLLNNPDAQFLFSGLDIAAGENGTPAFTPEKPLSPDGKYGDVIVQKGAILKSPTNSAKVGGRITLVGPNVVNQGTISTPDGQAILAAGLQVGFDSHSGSDPSLRGLDVYIGAVSDPVAGTYAGSVTHEGIMESARGSIILAGREINQFGVLESTTSVSLNGRIDLLAHFNAINDPNYNPTGSSSGSPFLYRDSGTVRLGEGSLMRILPEFDSKETTIGTELALRSQVNIAGKAIHFGEGSVLLAPNALVNINAGEWNISGGANPISRFIQSAGQVYLDEDALIDVSGSVGVSVPVSQNIISVDLRGAELADSPLQREGILRNTTIQVDLRDAGIFQGETWLGTPLANISGFANLIQRTVGQLTVAGGSVNISAGKSVVMRDGSKINVSGGSTRFEAGTVKTTLLITEGRLVDIGEAKPDVVYDGIYDGTFTEANDKFGVSDVFQGALAPDGGRFDPGSTEGAAGGKLSITAPSMALDGRFLGKTFTGEKQRLTPPASSILTLSFLAKDTTYPSLPTHAPAPPTITFRRNGGQDAAGPFRLDVNGDPSPLADNRMDEVILSSGLLSKDGFGELTINNDDGDIIVPEGVTLEGAAGASITFVASNITIDGTVSAAGGKLSFSSGNIPLDTVNQLANSSGAALPEALVGRGIFTLGPSGRVSTAGLLVDDRLTNESSGLVPLFLDGGSISVKSYSADLAFGGRIDVSGGAAVDARGQVSYGDGGAISISAGRDRAINSLLGGRLNLGATLSGFSGATAGSLTLAAPAIQVGGSTGNAGVTLLQAEFFNEGGFGTFSLNGTGLAGETPGKFVTGVYIAPEAEVHPVISGWVADTQGGKLKLRQITREEGVRAPGSISFNAAGGVNSFDSSILGRGDVILAEGASILTDAKGSVSFGGETVTLLGSVITPGGSITAGGAIRYPSTDPNLLLPTTLIGDSAFLSAAGKRVLTENAFGLRQGQVVAGGSITISGNIVAGRGAILDVSGASGILDLPPSSLSLDPAVLNSLNGKNFVPVEIHSNGGRITLSGSRMLYSDATLIGKAGGSSAIGGSVTVSSGRFVALGAPSNTAEANLVVRQEGFLLPGDFVSRGIGAELVDAAGDPLPGIGNFAVSTFSAGGFDSLSLNGNVSFDGDVTISTPGSLRIASGGVVYGGGDVKLSAGYVNLGQAFTTPKLATDPVILFTQTDASNVTTPYYFAPTHGSGGLTVKAGLIDIGNLSLQGIGVADFKAAKGDIRGNGTLSAAGALEFKAGQIYPTTAGSFEIFAYDSTSGKGSISILGGSTRQLPYSAGGTLGLFASEITQAGTLRAPIGTIILGWDGTGTAPSDAISGTTLTSPVTKRLTLASGGLTSVSAVDPVTGEALLVPYGISLDGNSWIDPAGNDITVRGVPGKSINLAATDVVTEKGSILDIAGGGDLYAYRWISGNGGTKDVLASSTSFAVIPGYSALYAPFAPFNSNSAATNLGGEAGYVNSSLKAGDQITLAGSSGLPAGTYTLLPARYALLPGAFLITPQSGSPVNTTRQPGGARLVSGYRSNNLDPSRTGSTIITRFDVASAKVVRERSEYQDLLANTVLREAAIAREFAVPRLPIDAGLLSFSSTEGMTLRGSVASATPDAGRGSVIDINSAANILINESGRGGAAGELVLSSRLLNSFGAESLLVGGLRSFGPDGSTVTVNSGNVTLDNAGAALTGEDVILVAREELVLRKNSVIRGTGSGESLDTLLLGDADIAGSGDGSLVRVSGNSVAPVIRSGVSSATTPDLIVGGGVKIKGGGIVLDSTSGTQLSSTAVIEGTAVSLSSGQISIRLKNPGALNATSGLVLSGDALDGLQQSARTLSLLSYSSLDVYGTGTVGSRSFEGLALQAASIRGFNTGGGTATFLAKNLLIENAAGRSASSPFSGALNGTIKFDADEITLGANSTSLDGFANAEIAADKRILVSGDGSFSTAGTLELITPLVTGGSAAKYRIASDGLLIVSRPGSSAATLQSGGFGAALTLEGARVKVDSDISLPSGELSLHATSGDLIVGDLAAANLDLAGTEARLLDVTRYTNGGIVNLISDQGDVRIGNSAEISVAARKGGGNAGGITVKAPEGSFNLAGSIDGSAGSDGRKGSFTLDTASVAAGSLASLDAVLNAGSFTQSRNYRIRTGDVTIGGLVRSHVYQVSADAGDILVTGTINASGETGGTIDLKANGSLVLANGAVLDASGDDFDAAGKGGAITLEASTQRNGVIDSGATLDLRSGSVINLSVAAMDSKSESLGRFSGTLHLRAPRNAANKDVAIETIGSTIRGASSILVEGVKLYGLTGAGAVTTTVQTGIRNDATAFLGAAGTTTAGYTAMLDRLTASNPGLDLILAPGVEIYNLNGSLTLGTATSTATSDWNLATLRFGPRKTAGVMTFRASENLTFFNALSDGFSGGTSLWLAPLMEFNPLLPANSQSWSLRLTAGADLSAASFREVRPLDSLGATSGLLQLGKNAGAATVTGGAAARTSTLISNFFQVIRTGSGDIDINTGRSLQLLNPFASIYTAGTRVADPTTVSTTNDFIVPILDRTVTQGNLGSAQQNYLAQYSMAGGNVTLSAGENIERKTRNNSGLIDDSSRQLPNNWLYRRGLLGPDGTFGAIRIGSGLGATTDPAASTSWWVDFSNFFQGVGALGGGNVTLSASHDVKNMDAVIPTNARAARGTPSAGSFIELGGGDLRVTSGNDINGGVYYVERGHGTLEAGGSIITNSTRSPSFGLAGNLNNPDSSRLDPLTWMPTTLFVGKSSFDVTASGDLLLGPVSNPFLLPQGINNRFWYKTYFSTIAPDSEVTASSLGGDVTFRNAVTLPGENQAKPMLQAWHQTQLLLSGTASTALLQPWLRLGETNLAPFSPVWSLTAASLSLSSLSGDVNLAGNLTLFPAATGQLEIVAAGSVNALQPTGLSNLLVAGKAVQSWVASTINLSDADPASIPSALAPLTGFAKSDTGAVPSSNTGTTFMDGLASLFSESGSITGSNAVLQTRQARHTPGALHRDDSEPLRIYALGGNLSGLTLFSGKEARVSAAVDLTDVSFYIQNLSASDVSVVSAGRNITAFNASSPLRIASLADGNALSVGQTPLAGDFQISGPGTLQVLAGGNLDLGIGANNADGTGTGITSIGNLRNPYLPAKGADLVVSAGIGPASSLASSQLALDAFIDKFVDTPAGNDYLKRIAPGVDFSEQPAEEQARLATEVFYLILRDTGRNFNDPKSDGYRKYSSGFKAIKALFPESIDWDGEILTQGRDIRTKSGGDISILAPGGGLTMAETTLGNPLAPPGIITESGGEISVFADQSVSIGIGRIFTLRGGDVMIWSSKGDIAAGSSSRTVQSAPPTRVVIDPQSASVETDLAGLATGGGIGVLATVEGVKPGDVDLIAPTGIIDAGDAGIRVSGNINLAAVTVVNAGNISAGGTSSGAPAATVSAPSISTVTSASNSSAAAGSTAVNPEDRKAAEPPATTDDALSLITVEVIGYGGGSDDEEEEEDAP